MTVTTDILDGIKAEALAFQNAKARYEAEFRRFAWSVPPLSPEHFWPMADAFRLTVLKTMLGRKERIGESAADEFFRLAVTGESKWSLPAAVHFAVSYRHYVRLACEGGDRCKFSFDRGDDGYGDLMDAVVLLGKGLNERLHAGKFSDLAAFINAVSDACNASVKASDFPFQYADDPVGNRLSLASRLRVMVLRGENYFAMSLEEAAAKWVAIESVKAEGRE